MLPRLQAEETREQLNLLVAAGGRQAEDKAYRQFVTGLDAQANPDATKRRAPRAPSVDAVQRFSGMRVHKVDQVASAITTTKPGERPGLKKKGGENG